LGFIFLGQQAKRQQSVPISPQLAKCVKPTLLLLLKQMALLSSAILSHSFKRTTRPFSTIPQMKYCEEVHTLKMDFASSPCVFHFPPFDLKAWLFLP